MKRSKVLALAFLFIAQCGFTYAQDGGRWRVYSPNHGVFSVETPAPLRKVMSFDGEHGASLEPDQKEENVSCYAAIETTPEDSRFGVIVINLRGRLLGSSKGEDRLEYLSAILIGDEDETQLMRVPRAVEHNGLTGKEYFYVKDAGLFTRGRIFVAGGKIYVIVFVGRNDKDLTSTDAERFLNSFRLHKRIPRT